MDPPQATREAGSPQAPRGGPQSDRGSLGDRLRRLAGNPLVIVLTFPLWFPLAVLGTGLPFLPVLLGVWLGDLVAGGTGAGVGGVLGFLLILWIGTRDVGAHPTGSWDRPPQGRW